MNLHFQNWSIYVENVSLLLYVNINDTLLMGDNCTIIASRNHRIDFLGLKAHDKLKSIFYLDNTKMWVTYNSY